MTADVASYLVHHVVLPPKLPQKDDYNPDHEQCLLDTVIHALQDVEDLVEGPELKALVTSAVGSVTNLYHSRDKYGGVSELELGKLLHKLAYITTAEMVPLEIKAQNAGLILSRSADSIAFEPFELSPVNGAAIGTAGRLVRKFPGGASEIPISLMKQQDFRTEEWARPRGRPRHYRPFNDHGLAHELHRRPWKDNWHCAHIEEHP
jgi:hypothetical protein